MHTVAQFLNVTVPNYQGKTNHKIDHFHHFQAVFISFSSFQQETFLNHCVCLNNMVYIYPTHKFRHTWSFLQPPICCLFSGLAKISFLFTTIHHKCTIKWNDSSWFCIQWLKQTRSVLVCVLMCVRARVCVCACVYAYRFLLQQFLLFENVWLVMEN